MSLDRLIRAHDDLRRLAVRDAVSRPFAAARLITGLLIIAHAELRLAGTREQVADAARRYTEARPRLLDRVLLRVSGLPYYSTSTETLAQLCTDTPHSVRERLRVYSGSFSDDVRRLLESLEFDDMVGWLAARDANLLRHTIVLVLHALPLLDENAALDALWGRYAEAAFGQASREAAEVVARILPHPRITEPVALWDPLGQSGELLVAMARAISPAASVKARVTSEIQFALASARLFLADLQAEIGLDPVPPRVEGGGYIVCAPSWGRRRDLPEDLGWEDFRARLKQSVGTPLPDMPPDVAAAPVVEGLALMGANRGACYRAAFLLPTSWTHAGNRLASLREWLARTGWLDMVVQLPSGAVRRSPQFAHVWLFDTHRDRRQPIRLVDCRDCRVKEGRRSTIDVDGVARHVSTLTPGRVHEVTTQQFSEGIRFASIFAPPPEDTRDELESALKSMAEATSAALGARLGEATLHRVQIAHRQLGKALRAHQIALDATSVSGPRGAEDD